MPQQTLGHPVRKAVLVLAAATSCWLAGCASAPPAAAPQTLLHDAAFGPPVAVLQADDVTALSPDMQQFASRLLARSSRQHDLRDALLTALHRGGQLRLRYDTSYTRTAAQAFESRSGNCLSLVLMTAALARELRMPVTYQTVISEVDYSRQDTLLFASGHVNVVLGRPARAVHHVAHDSDRELTVDFLPKQELAGQRVTRVSEATVQAMYMNNRAAELLAEAGKGRELPAHGAYWWARQAVLLDPSFLPGINTMGVIYLRHGHPLQAERAFKHVLQQDPRQTAAMANLVRLLHSQGRSAEAGPWTAALAALQPDPPFQQLDLGRDALAAGDTDRARDLFLAELRRQPYQSEVHYWLAVALVKMGDTERAARHLALAVNHSTTAAAQDIYAGKLERLRQAPK